MILSMLGFTKSLAIASCTLITALLPQSPARVEVDEQMHVIRHDLKGMYCHFKLTGFLMQQGFKAHRNLIGKHRPTVFGTPNNMQLKTKYGSSIFSVSAHK